MRLTCLSRCCRWLCPCRLSIFEFIGMSGTITMPPFAGSGMLSLNFFVSVLAPRGGEAGKEAFSQPIHGTALFLDRTFAAESFCNWPGPPLARWVDLER